MAGLIDIGIERRKRERLMDQLMGLLGPQEAAGPAQPGMPQPQIEGLLPQNLAQTISGLMSNPQTQQIGAGLLQQQLQQQFAQPEPVKFGDVSSVRKETKPLRDSFRDSNRFFTAMQSSFKAPSGKGRAAADLAMVINFAKMLDPTSVVRSEEGETIQKTGGFLGALKGMEQQIRGAGSLDNNARSGLMLEATRQYGANLDSLESEVGFYRDIASEMGVEPSKVLTKEMLDFTEERGTAKDILERLSGSLGSPEAIRQAPAKEFRSPGTVYSTPKGNFKWTGTGWAKP